MKNPTRSLVIIVLIIASISSIVLTGIGALNLYMNSKTDGFGGGHITVEGDCKEIIWAWRVDKCTGRYRAAAGDITRENVSVIVSGGSSRTIVPDVYPLAGTTNLTTQTFITGKERSSVIYNTPWIATIFIGLLIPAVTITYLLARRTKQ